MGSRPYIVPKAHIPQPPPPCFYLLYPQGGQALDGGKVKHLSEKTGMYSDAPYRLRHSYRAGIQLIPAALYELEVPYKNYHSASSTKAALPPFMEWP